jgi:hypothetical protein
MTEAAAETMVRYTRTAWRLVRLFRIERAGRLDQLPMETVGRLIERRGRLVGELLVLDGMRASSTASGSAELKRSLAALAREVGLSLRLAKARLDRIGDSLSRRSGAGLPTGLRDGANGRLLGKS